MPQHHDKILSALKGMPEGGTIGEIAKRSGLEYSAVGRRIGELVAKGEVRDSGHFGKSPKGRKAIVWEIVPIQQGQGKLFS